MNIRSRKIEISKWISTIYFNYIFIIIEKPWDKLHISWIYWVLWVVLDQMWLLKNIANNRGKAAASYLVGKNRINAIEAEKKSSNSTKLMNEKYLKNWEKACQLLNAITERNASNDFKHFMILLVHIIIFHGNIIVSSLITRGSTGKSAWGQSDGSTPFTKLYVPRTCFHCLCADGVVSS